MYNTKDYITRGVKFANNILLPGHKKLSTLMIYGTDLCDSGCKHCLIWAKRPTVHLPLEKIIEIMNSKCVSKSTTVGLEGGEFLLHPEATEILQWFSANHPRFDLLSNCLKPEGVIEAVKEYPPSRLYLSLDGDKETYKYMRGKDGYDNVLHVIEECRKLVPISAMFTLSPYNDFDDLEHVIKVCQKYDIDVRVGVYSNIAFFDTLDKAHETDISTKVDTHMLKYKEVKHLVQGGTSTLNTEINVVERENINIPIHDEEKIISSNSFKSSVPDIVKETAENYDFLLLYDEWRKKNTKLKCFSILDSIIVLPNGDVPICQNLDLKLGNIYEKPLDEVFNSAASQNTQKEYVHNCNQCWINFHRKYDIVMMRSMEKVMPKWVVEKLFGQYQWSDDPNITYDKFMKKYDGSRN